MANLTTDITDITLTNYWKNFFCAQYNINILNIMGGEKGREL